ncbi:MAG: TIGR04290 family methyltransferase [Bdellovibrionales bacterium]
MNHHNLEQAVHQLGPWFHNLHLPDGVQTAPNHFLGDFPLRKWEKLEPHLPADIHGWSVLDIGCNAGFYSFEFAKRGARVLGIDSDPHYLNQARWVAENVYIENAPEFRQMDVHSLARLYQEFDLVLFMGVFYHLRYPLLALDTVAAKTRRLMIFQSLTMNGDEVVQPEADYDLSHREMFDEPGWPKMGFIEGKFSQDPTNWWVPNHAAAEALLRSTGFTRVRRIAHEIYFCEPPENGIIARREWDRGEWESATGVEMKRPTSFSEGRNRNTGGQL